MGADDAEMASCKRPRPRPGRRQRPEAPGASGKDAQELKTATGEVFEGVFLPLSMGGRPRSRPRESAPLPARALAGTPRRLKYEGKAAEAWDELEDANEWSINAQLLLREEYLYRLRTACLPLVAQEASAADPHDVAEAFDEGGLLHVAGLLREITVDVIANICKARSGPRAPFLWRGKNILLEMPADLDFGANVPALARLLQVESLARNPFIEPDGLPRPDSERGQAILNAGASPNESARARARRAILEEENLHGVRRVEGAFARWKEFEDLRARAGRKAALDRALAREMMPKLARVTVSPHNVHCFRRQDADGDGILTYKEFLRGMKLLLLPFSLTSDAETRWILEQVDPQRAGWVSYTAFNKLCERAKGVNRPTRPDREQPHKQDAHSDTEARGPDYDDAHGQERDEPAWLAEYTGMERRLEKVRARLDKLESERSEVDAELRAGLEQTPSSPRVEMSAHAEYVAANEKRHAAIVGDLRSYLVELDEAIGQLRMQEVELVREQRELKTRALRNREILQNQREELEMARQEKAQRKAWRKEEEAIKRRQRALAKEAEAKYREEQRALRRREMRDKLRREHSAATRIANSFRAWQARMRLAWLAQSALEAHDAIHRSQLFDTREKRLLERPTPLLVLASGARGDRVASFLKRAMPGNFWAHAPMIENPESVSIAEMLQTRLERAAGIFWSLPHDLTEDLAAALLLALESVRPRPLVVYVGDCGRHGDRDGKWLRGALRHVDGARLCAAVKPLEEESARALAEAAAYLLPGEVDLAGGEGDDGAAAPEAHVLARLVRACRNASDWHTPKKRVHAAGEVVKKSEAWPRTAFGENAAAAAVRAFVETKTGCSTQNLARELVDIDLTGEKLEHCEDIILHYGLRELRIFQSATDDTTLFRYGSRHVIVRTVPRGDDVVYRIYDARALAYRLAHCSGDLRSKLERMRAGKRARTLETLCREDAEGLVVTRLHAATRLIEDDGGSRLVLWRGTKAGYVCWMYRDENRSGRVQIKMVSSGSPFRELRGSLAVDPSLEGRGLEQYLLGAIGRLRPNPLTGLVNLAQ